MRTDRVVDTGTELRHDSRNLHQRLVDALTLYNIENYDDRSYDLIVREVDYFYNEDNSPGADDFLYGNNKGDIDLGLIDLDERMIRAFEVKSGLKFFSSGKEQMKKLADTVSNISDAADGRWNVTGNVVLEEDLDPKYLTPPFYRGDFYAEKEELERIRESDEMEELNELMFDERLELDEEELLQEKI